MPLLQTCTDSALMVKVQGPVVRRPISTNLRLNFNPGFFSFNSKASSRIIFSILLRSSNHHNNYYCK